MPSGHLQAPLSGPVTFECHREAASGPEAGPTMICEMLYLPSI